MGKKYFLILVILLCAAASSYARPIKDTGDPNEPACNPHSYTDLGNGIVRDNVTGLEWQQSTAPGTYTWQQAIDYCEALILGGHSDWRLPTLEELATLIDSGMYSPAIAPVFDAVALTYWASTAFSEVATNAWIVNFISGMATPIHKDNDNIYVRAVRGGPHSHIDGFVWNFGTVTDPNTNLMWQQCNYGQTWNGTACTGTWAPRTWQEAVDEVAALNSSSHLGYNDWRLPTRNELQTLVDYTRHSPATDLANTAAGIYWSSTASASTADDRWTVAFGYGDVESIPKHNSFYLRAVRGGDCWRQAQVDKATVKAGKLYGHDSLQITGLLDIIPSDMNDALFDDIIVTLEAEHIPDPWQTRFIFPPAGQNLNGTRYTSPKVKPVNKTDPIESFSFDYLTGAMKFSGKNVDLTGVDCPIAFMVRIGDYVGGTYLHEETLNGPKKPCPLPLLMGVKNSLAWLKVKAKKGTAPGTDAFSISGTFTVDNTFSPGEPVIIQLGADMFTLDYDQLTFSKGVHSCKNADSGNGFITAKFDTVKCRYAISIKNASISGSGDVDFGIDMCGASLESSSPVSLPLEF